MPRIIKMAKGTYTASTITVDSDGRVVAAASGAAGGGAGILKFAGTGPASGTWTANPGANLAMAYICAGGGGGGGTNQPGSGGSGGDGGYGYFSGPVTGGSGYAYNIGTVGSPGNGWPGPNDGGAGSASALTNVGTANAGNGGTKRSPAGSGTSGNAGSVPGADCDITIDNGIGMAFAPGQTPTGGFGFGASGAPYAPGSPNPAPPAGKGFIAIFDNSGT